MPWVDELTILLAGFAAGTVNTVVGSGTLITFPTLLAFGVPPVTANIANTTGLAFGSWSSVIASRPELTNQWVRVRSLAPASIGGGLLGGMLLLTLPERAFSAIVPALLLLGVALVAFQPHLARWVARRHAGLARVEQAPWVWSAVFGAGVYGGYFGAAQGILLLAILGNGVQDSLHRINATKNVCAAFANTVSALLFVATALVEWKLAALIALGSIVGGQVGGPLARRLPATALRTFIVVVGLVAVATLLS
jgi:uncharacterized protein